MQIDRQGVQREHGVPPVVEHHSVLDGSNISPSMLGAAQAMTVHALGREAGRYRVTLSYEELLHCLLKASPEALSDRVREMEGFDYSAEQFASVIRYLVVGVLQREA